MYSYLKHRPLLTAAIVAVLMLDVAWVGWSAYKEWAIAHYSPVERGRRLADQLGCFSCHGPGGISGIRNPTDGGDGTSYIPPWHSGTVRNTIYSEQEISEWIMDGLPARIRDNPQQLEDYRKHRVQMPAYREHISPAQLKDLVAYFKAVTLYKNPSPEALQGRRVAESLGCFACHGPEGRGLVANPASLKGYIPAWTGPDYDELVKNDEELEEWILKGSIERLNDNPAAKFFLDRQAIPMPAYEGFVTEGELDNLKAYIRWLRKTYPR